MKMRLLGTKASRNKLFKLVKLLTNHKLKVRKIKTKNKKKFKYFINISKSAGSRSKLKNGNKLVKRIINSNKTCTLSIKYKERSSTGYSNADNIANKKGTNASVWYNPGSLHKVVTRNGAGKVIESYSPGHIVLGHELIHADRFMRGIAKPYNSENTTTYTYMDKFGLFRTGEEYLDELETTGLGIYDNIIKDVTENKLRKEQGQGRRLKY
jgi:hypothetical protein